MIYSRQIRSAVSIAPAAAAKRHISLCGCVHHFILVVSLFDRQYKSQAGLLSALYDCLHNRLIPKCYDMNASFLFLVKIKTEHITFFR